MRALVRTRRRARPGSLGRPARAITVLAALAAPAALSGCVVGPDFAPAAPITADRGSFVDVGSPTAPHVPILAGTTAAPTETEWWRVFRDPLLSRLEARVADANLDVRQATLRIAQSRANVASAVSAGAPTLNGRFADVREQFSQNGLVSLVPAGLLGGGGPSPIVTGYNNYLVGFDAAWELDLWGRVARSVEAADAQYAMSQEARRDTLVSSLAELARDYVNLRGTQEQIRVVRANLKVEREILAVTKERQGKGLVTGLDTESAATQAASIEAQIPQLQAQESAQINAIGLLLGEPPLTLSGELASTGTVPPNPPRVPLGLPSELARRRPDIREAEAQLHAATANVGVAVAEFFPSVRLNADPTLQAIDPKNLFKGTSLQTMQFGPSVTLPIFQGGRLKANLVMNEKNQQLAAIAYHRAVLNAWHDVVNQLTAYRTEQLRRDHLVAQVGHARQALAFARSRYGEGVTDITTVLTNAQTLLSAEQQVAQSATIVSVDLVALYKALGGGWELTYPDPGALPVATLRER